MSPVEILKSAKARIADPAQWCQGAVSVNSRGGLVDPWDPKARRWCAAGAIWREIHRRRSVFPGALHIAAQMFGYPSAQVLNDNSSHADVMRMFDRAMGIAKET